jgi:hypothetical protein
LSWAVGFDTTWNRDIGYGVPALCDHPQCYELIDRGLGYVCGNEEPYGGEDGCGLYFCTEHGGGTLCSRCRNSKPPFKPKRDTAEWIRHKETDPSWAEWRAERDARKVDQG